MAETRSLAQYYLTGHAKQEMLRRQITEDDVRIVYDRETDTLTVIFVELPVAESDEDKPGVILDYDAAGNLVSLEILDASRRVSLPSRMDYQVAPTPA